jgi:proteasome assembly chaperone (PAC2) family protein
MAPEKLHIFERPKLSNPRILLGFSGWMDGGEVSTGTVKYLIDKLGAQKFAEIEPEEFYIYSFPGSMEMTALFRPHAKIKEGLVSSFEVPKNEFFHDKKNNLILFSGKEPNMRWREFAECVFSLCSEFKVATIYFIGSVAGLVPHTREPRLLCSVSDAKLKETFQRYGVKFANYEGPASFITWLTANAGERGLNMTSFVATIPAYVQGNNPKCIEAVTRRLAGILELQMQPELAGNIQKLEEDYDNEIFNSEMGELRKWLEQQGIRLD